MRLDFRVARSCVTRTNVMYVQNIVKLQVTAANPKKSDPAGSSTQQVTMANKNKRIAKTIAIMLNAMAVLK